jgi:hypothetical protein
VPNEVLRRQHRLEGRPKGGGPKNQQAGHNGNRSRKLREVADSPRPIEGKEDDPDAHLALFGPRPAGKGARASGRWSGDSVKTRSLVHLD